MSSLVLSVVGKYAAPGSRLRFITSVRGAVVLPQTGIRRWQSTDAAHGTEEVRPRKAFKRFPRSRPRTFRKDAEPSSQALRASMRKLSRFPGTMPPNLPHFGRLQWCMHCAMLTACAEEDASKVLDIYKDFWDLQVIPVSMTYRYTIHMMLASGRYREAQELLQEAGKRAVSIDTGTLNIMLLASVGARNAGAIEATWELVTHGEADATLLSYVTLACGYLLTGQAGKAYDILNEFRSDELSSKSVFYTLYRLLHADVVFSISRGMSRSSATGVMDGLVRYYTQAGLEPTTSEIVMVGQLLLQLDMYEQFERLIKSPASQNVLTVAHLEGFIAAGLHSVHTLDKALVGGRRLHRATQRAVRFAWSMVQSLEATGHVFADSTLAGLTRRSYSGQMYEISIQALTMMKNQGYKLRDYDAFWNICAVSHDESLGVTFDIQEYAEALLIDPPTAEEAEQIIKNTRKKRAVQARRLRDREARMMAMSQRNNNHHNSG